MSSGNDTTRRRAIMQLPKPPAQYDPHDQMVMRQAIEQHWHPETASTGSAGTSAPQLDLLALVTSADDTTVTITVKVIDPYPQGAGTLTLGVTFIHNATSLTVSGVAVTTSSTWTLSSGDSVVFVIGRAAFGSGEASVEWSLTDNNQKRTPDYEAITVTEHRGGVTWYDGTTVPASTLGIDGDYYLNDTTGDISKKTSGAWGVVANILGPNYPVTVSNGVPTGTPSDGELWIEY